ncbi:MULTISPECIES: Eco57I restriction-modification methylase domain-containing protein [Pseudomonadota]|uniref:Eco57I restriction-modification methylase domain-containing protein n=1 Tax=Pseudomonadota TaxID=1224 RepID=UPI00122B9DF6|nr:Eco57I restriction-modification methylase domain-containing protein [Paraburkholderia sp.]TAL99530.1 MAG: modification methylase PaeR7I [Paraburkholderia sp.]
MNALDLFEDTVRLPELDAAVLRMAGDSETGRGAVFTRPEVVTAILDLCGYRAEFPLHRLRLLEPSFGGGDFLLPAVDRLLETYARAGGTPAQAREALQACVRAVELHEQSFGQTRAALCARLEAWGMPAPDAEALCTDWLLQDDFLLANVQPGFDVVVGNPPYVRQERIPAALLREYRRRFQTLYDRADLYVPFFERSLDLLGEGGVLGFICANRWLKNRYGGPLREKISDGYWLKYFIDTEGADAFHADVIAYPAITVIQRPVTLAEPRPTRAVHADAVESLPLPELAAGLLSEEGSAAWVQQIELAGTGDAPLLLDDLARLALMQRIERDFPVLEQTGCKVGIGVATGCDRVFIGMLDELPVEATRKLPLVMARDLVDGGIQWSGKGVVNPFDDDGDLVDLACYPELRDYLDEHCDAVRGRNVAKRNPSGWYRTIDRIQPGLLETPKLLVPDIKGEGVFVYDEGHYYPHHNLYFITSESWDLRALQAVLRSSVTLMTVATYCTRMAGGFLRFQAQYLRRIRLPRWQRVATDMRQRLVAVAGERNQTLVDAPVFELYGLDTREAAEVRAIADAARTSKGSA